MWTRKELKSVAKDYLKAKYWYAVVMAIISAVCAGGSAAATSRSAKVDFTGMPLELIIATFIAALTAILVASVIGILIKAFALNPLYVGCMKFFAEKDMEDTDIINHLTYAFKNGYMNIVKTEFLKNLFIGLWSLLLIVPGVVKKYEYRMVSYILTENPEMNYKDALELSRRMMNGHKWNAFVLDLSFIGWYLLTGITMGLLAIFYVNPYVQFTNAQLYHTLKNQNN